MEAADFIDIKPIKTNCRKGELGGLILSKDIIKTNKILLILLIK